MMTEKIICNAKDGTVTREWIEDNTPMWVDYPAMIEDCKQRLAQTDYAVVKIAEGVATREEYADLLAERKALRERIAMLEQQQIQDMA